MRVGLYLRVSTLEQAKEGYSIGEQESRLKDYCKAMRWTVFKIYVDPGYSGGNIDRPGLQDLISDVKEGLLDKVVVYKLDRLSRSQYDTLYLIEKMFLANNTDFVSMTENFSTGSPLGRAMIGFLAVFAQLEKDKINERTILGKEARAKEGKWHGGATEPIGYDYDISTDLLRVNEYEAIQIRELFELFLNGTPLRRIETIFLEKGYKHKHGNWTPGSMRRVIQNKLYLGYIRYHDTYYKAEHDAIIDEDTFNKAQVLMKARLDAYQHSGAKPGAQTTYLGGLIYCKYCGGKFAKQLNSRYREGKPKVYWYMCYSRCKRVKKMIKDPNCKNKNWKMKELDDLIFNEIRKLALAPEYIQNAKHKKNEHSDEAHKIEIIEKEIKNIDAQISRFMDLYGIGKFTIDQVSGKVDPLNEQKRALEKELNALTSTGEELTEDEIIEYVKSFEEALEFGDFDKTRAIIETLIHHIEIDNEDVYIHWTF